MAFKTNYHHQRTERDRAKQAKKEVKLQQKKELQASRKAEQQPTGEGAAAPEEPAQD
jgi:hypothetical protein